MREMREKLAMCRGTGKYDDQLNRICLRSEPQPFFGALHPELLPYVGQNYEKTGVLLVGESHYVKQATEAQLEQADWYHNPLPDGTDSPFDKRNGYVEWFDTREVFVRYMNDDRSKSYRIFSEPTAVLHELGLNSGEKYRDFDYFAFMNFFQRPSIAEGESIQDSPADRLAANDVLEQVVSILRPRAVVFLSKKAFYAFEKERCPGTMFYAVSHPNSPWWYRARRDGGCAREDFKNILQEVILSDNTARLI